MIYKLEIDTENAAFKNDSAELVRILREIAGRIEAAGYYLDANLIDSNGTTVGFARPTNL